ALVSDILLVDEAMLENAVETLLDRQKLVAEGAGAAALAAVLAAPERFAGRRVGIVVSGGNIDLRLLASILMRGKEPGPPAETATLADGIAVKEPGRLTRRIVKALVSDILLVDEAMLENAVETLLDRQKLVAEGAGAAGLAAVLAAPEHFAGRRVGIVLSGGNIDVRLLASILMRGLVREGRLVRLRAELPDLPGVLSRVSGIIGKHAGNIVEVHHQRLFHDTSVRRAELDVVVETQNRRHAEALIAALNAAGFLTRLLSTANGGEG
ncbi:MAG: pyridoxal-phosphate dependent enzyme, partial [Stellaceae bacterium]